MKFFLSTAKQLDLNFQFGTSGSVDNVVYEVPSFSQDIISISSAGLITPLKAGTAIVNIRQQGTNALIESATVLVLSPEDYALQLGLAAGTTALTANAVVSQAPTYISFEPVVTWNGDSYGTTFRTFASNNGPDPYWVIFDNNPATYILTSNLNGFGIFSTISKTLKQVKIKAAPQGVSAWPAPSDVSIYGSNESYDIQGFSNAEIAQQSFWTLLKTESNLSWSGGEEKTFDITNNQTAYKHYKILASHAAGTVAIAELTLLGT